MLEMTQEGDLLASNLGNAFLTNVGYFHQFDMSTSLAERQEVL